MSIIQTPLSITAIEDNAKYVEKHADLSTIGKCYGLINNMFTSVAETQRVIKGDVVNEYIIPYAYEKMELIGNYTQDTIITELNNLEDYDTYSTSQPFKDNSAILRMSLENNSIDITGNNSGNWVGNETYAEYNNKTWAYFDGASYISLISDISDNFIAGKDWTVRVSFVVNEKSLYGRVIDFNGRLIISIDDTYDAIFIRHNLNSDYSGRIVFKHKITLNTAYDLVISYSSSKDDYTIIINNEVYIPAIINVDAAVPDEATTGSFIGKSNYTSDSLFNGLVSRLEVYTKSFYIGDLRGILNCKFKRITFNESTLLGDLSNPDAAYFYYTKKDLVYTYDSSTGTITTSEELYPNDELVLNNNGNYIKFNAKVTVNYDKTRTIDVSELNVINPIELYLINKHQLGITYGDRPIEAVDDVTTFEVIMDPTTDASDVFETVSDVLNVRYEDLSKGVTTDNPVGLYSDKGTVNINTINTIDITDDIDPFRDNSLLVKMRFENNLDSAIPGATVTVKGPTPAYVPGVNGMAIESVVSSTADSEGYTTSKIIITPPAPLGKVVTISAWLKWNGTPGVMPFSILPSYDLYFYETLIGFNTGIDDITGLYNKYDWNTFHHFVVEFREGELGKIWIDGVEQVLKYKYRAPDTSKMITSGQDICIFGFDAINTYSNFGTVDEFHVFDRSLTNAEVVALYNNCKLRLISPDVITVPSKILQLPKHELLKHTNTIYYITETGMALTHTVEDKYIDEGASIIQRAMHRFTTTTSLRSDIKSNIVLSSTTPVIEG